MLPGDSIELDDDNKDIIIGPGFRKEGNKLIATKCGVYKTTNKISYWIEAAEKRVNFFPKLINKINLVLVKLTIIKRSMFQFEMNMLLEL